jgi:hypothetical protein
VDLPLVAIKQAAQRAQTDNIQSRTHCVQGSGASLPIADQSYDRLNHSDVLCCMPEKRELLEECRRVASDSAVMHFSVILPASGLSSRDYKRVLDIGPPHIDTPDGYDKMLVETGWRIRTFVDVTDEFNTRLKALNWGLGTYKNELIKVYGKTEYHDEVSRRKTEQQLASQHLMKRVIYIVDAIT